MHSLSSSTSTLWCSVRHVHAIHSLLSTQAAVSRFWPPFLTILIGTYFGVAILADIDDQSLFIVVGAIVISAAFFQGSSFKFHLTPASEKPAGFIFGAASGLIGGLSSFFGPMLIIYLLSIPQIKNQMPLRCKQLMELP